jgi:hypothetical protein
MRRPVPHLLLAAALAQVVPAAPAEAQYFGRNKVQYRTFDFQVIRTEHFDVYYYPEARDAALDAARMVERAYARLSRVLQHEFRERKPLIVYASHADFQQTNALPFMLDEGTGGVTESLKNRMILPFTGSYAEFDHVLTHELVHAFQYDVIFRRGLMSEAMPLSHRLPLWFMEGMAEYLSIGRIDPHTTSWLRDAVLQGYLRSIGEMMVRDDYLSYRFGQSLWAYVAGRWGDEVVGILLQKAPRMGVERAFASTLNVTLEELNREWQAAVRAEFLAQVTEYDTPDRFAQPVHVRARLGDPWYLAPALSPDGTQLVFLSQRDGFSFDLWLADAADGRVRRRLVQSARDADFESLRFMNSGAAFSPDGRYLAFASKAGGEDALNIYDLRLNRVTKRLRFGLNGIRSPSWSPDGRQLVFTGLDGGLSDLFVADVEDGRLQRLTHDRYAALLPAWAPDGRTIAFTTDRAGTDLDRLVYGNMRVALLDVASGAVEVLPGQDAGRNSNPVWSPDGRQLIWVGDRSGTSDLYLFDLEDRSLARITSMLSGAVAVTPLSPVLSWSQSGALLFTHFESAGYSTWRIPDPLVLPRTTAHGVLADAAAAYAVAIDDAAAAPLLPAPDPVRPGRGSASWYREVHGGLRASAELPAGVDVPAPISVAALLDSAELALADTASFEFDRYRPRLAADVVGRPTVGTQVGSGHYGNGMYGGSYVALSDMLGNHNAVVAGSISGSFADASVLGGYSLLRSRTNYGVTAWQVPLYRYMGGGFLPMQVGGEQRLVAANLFLRDVIRGAQAGFSYPFSTFRRVEVNATAVSYRSQVLFRGFDAATYEPVELEQDLDGFTYLQPQVATVFDNAVFGWTGPVEGRRYRAQLSRTVGDLRFTELLVDFRNYLNWNRRVVLAARVVGLARMGEGTERFGRFWGGPYHLRGYDYFSFDPRGDECAVSADGEAGAISRCPVRDQLVGSSAAFVNAEIRFPFVTELQLGAMGAFPPIDAVAFVDGGLAWDRHLCTQPDYGRRDRCAAGQASEVTVRWRRGPGDDPLLVRAPLFSYGLGLRFNLYYVLLRVDYARPLDRPRRNGVLSFSFGPSF